MKKTLDAKAALKAGEEQVEPITLGQAMVTGTEQFKIIPDEDDTPGEQDPPEQNLADDESKPGEPTQDDRNKDYRFADHDKAEEGFRNQQSEITKTQQEIVNLKEKLAGYEAKDLEQQQAESKQEVKTFAGEENKKALDLIDNLDQDAPDHGEQVAAIWAEAHLNVADFRDSKASEAALPAAAEEPAAEPHAADESLATDEQGGDDEADSIAYIDQQLDEQDLDKFDRGLFYTLAKDAPSVDEAGNPIELSEQVKLTLQAVNNHKEAQRSKLLQELDLPLDRGGAGGSGGGNTPPAPPKQLSLAGAMRKASVSRTL